MIEVTTNSQSGSRIENIDGANVSGVYGIWCDDDVYVGASSNIMRRWESHMRRLRAHKHDVPRLQSFFDERGACHMRFTILEETDAEEIFVVEKKWGVRYSKILMNRLPFAPADLRDYYNSIIRKCVVAHPTWRDWMDLCAYTPELARKELGLANGTFYRRIKSEPDALTRLAMAALYEGLEPWGVS